MERGIVGVHAYPCPCGDLFQITKEELKLARRGNQALPKLFSLYHRHVQRRGLRRLQTQE